MGEASIIDVEVAVVGAGLSGLTAATVAGRLGASVMLLDVRSAGGRARSDEHDGFILNQGPHALYRAGLGVGVLGRLGVKFEGSLPPSAVAGYREGAGDLAVLPTSAASLLRSPLVGIGDKVRLGRLLATLAKVEAASLAPLSASEWIASLRLTPKGIAILSALARVGTYASDLSLISADAAVGQLQLAIKGNVLYLDKGWQTLVDGLVTASSNAGARLEEGERVINVQAGENGTWEVSTQVRKVRASSVVIAPGSPAAARAMLPGAPDWELGPPATAACLDLGLSIPPPTKAAYGLDAPLYFSTHCPNASLAPAGSAVVHVMRYGARTSPEDRKALWTLARRCGVNDNEVVAQRFLHEMTVCHALPRPTTDSPGDPALPAPASREYSWLATGLVLWDCWPTPRWQAERYPGRGRRNEQ